MTMEKNKFDSINAGDRKDLGYSKKTQPCAIHQWIIS